MTLWTKIKRRIVNSLAREMRDHDARCRAMQNVVLETGAALSPESLIENLSSRREAITIGPHSFVRGHLCVYPNGGSIKLGSWCYVGARTQIWSMSSIQIGDRVLIAHDVNILDSTAHSRDPAERHAQFRAILTTGHPPTWVDLPGITSKPIVIEDDVWISCGVTILQGVRIGARSIIAAGATVTRDVPPDVLYRNQITPILTPL